MIPKHAFEPGIRLDYSYHLILIILKAELCDLIMRFFIVVKSLERSQICIDCAESNPYIQILKKPEVAENYARYASKAILLLIMSAIEYKEYNFFDFSILHRPRWDQTQ